MACTSDWHVCGPGRSRPLRQVPMDGTAAGNGVTGILEPAGGVAGGAGHREGRGPSLPLTGAKSKKESLPQSGLCFCWELDRETRRRCSATRRLATVLPDHRRTSRSGGAAAYP